MCAFRSNTLGILLLVARCALGQAPGINTGEYFLNTDPGVGNGTSFPVTPGATTQAVFLGDATALQPGLHSVNIRFKDAAGQWGIAKGHHFLVVDPSGGETFTPAPDIVAGEYFLNADPGVGNATAFNVTPGASTQAVFLGDASALPLGEHTVMVRFKDADAQWGIARPHAFTVAEPGANDDCADAQPLAPVAGGTCAVSAVSGSTVGSGADATVDCMAGNLHDAWYILNADTITSVRVELTSAIGLQVLDACGGGVLYCSEGNEHLFTTAPQTEYVLRVLTAEPGVFSICASSTQVVYDCLGTPGGTALPGTACNDDDPATGNDVYGEDCQCAGEPLDCTGIPGGTALPGMPCTTGGEAGTWSAGCACVVPRPDIAVENVTAAPTTIAPGDEVAVEWTVYNIGTAPSTKTWTERIYVESSMGQNRTLLLESPFSEAGEIGVGTNLPRSRMVTIPVQFNVGDQCVFVVQLVPGTGLLEQPGATANNTGTQQTGWNIVKLLTVHPSALQVQEGAPAGVTATVRRSGSLASSLVVDLGISEAERFNIPPTVTILAGQPGRTFTVVALDNADLEGPVQATLTASASGFQPSQAAVTVLDNELPALAITGLPPAVMEGDVLSLSVVTSMAPSAPLQVALSSSNIARFPVPASVTIPVGETSVPVQITLAQDNVPELDITITLQASAIEHASASATTTLGDDDIPGLGLVLSTDTVSESGGAAALQGVLRRLSGSGSLAFTANITADMPNTLLLPASESLAAGENEKSFTIGVVDNSQVDGFRNMTITAALVVPGCGCGAPPASAGYVQAGLVVADNDGPALTLVPTPLTLAEGQAMAGNLRVQRNTAVDTALTVALSSNDPGEATLPASVTVPIGATFVDVPITTIDDGQPDGSQQVYLHATAPGFSPGIAWVMVTDVNKPDLSITGVSVPVTSIPALGSISYEAYVTNSGFATAPSGVLVRAYLSADANVDANDLVLAEHVIAGPIAVGATTTVMGTAIVPATAGNHRLLFRVNPLSAITELLFTNNTSAPVEVAVTAAFTATTTVQQPWYFRGTPVPVTGTAQWLDATPAANQQVEVYVLVDGLRRELTATTDANGAFNTTFTPLSNEAGHYTVGASYPGIGATAEQDAFDLLGVRVNNGASVVLPAILGDTVHGKLHVRNLSTVDLPALTLAPVSLPTGGAVVFDTIPLLAGLTTDSISYMLTGTAATAGMNFQPAQLKAIASQGELHPVQSYYYCLAPGALLTSSTTHLNATVSASMGQQLVEVRFRNVGAGPTGNVQLLLPQVAWLTTMTPAILPSLAPGDSAIAILRFQALPEVPFDYPINSNIVFTPQNGASLSIPFTFTKVSQTTGEVVVDVTDEFTYYSPGGPKVAGALVRIKHYFTNVVFAEGLTDATGRFTATDVPEGIHRITVEKEQHASYSGTVTVVPGNSVQKTVFINYQAITFSWTVVPTAIEDEYTVTLTTQFETHVPLPVVTIDMPDTMPRLFGDEVFAFHVTLTNHGLIAAQQVSLFLPVDEEYEFLTNYEAADLPALSSIQVPVLMRRRLVSQLLLESEDVILETSEFLGMDESQFMHIRTIVETVCIGVTRVVYFYPCDIFVTGKTVACSFSYRDRECFTIIPPPPPPPPDTAFVDPNDCFCCHYPWLCEDWGGGVFIVDPTFGRSLVEEVNCRKCVKDLLGLAPCVDSGPVGQGIGWGVCGWDVLDWSSGQAGFSDVVWSCGGMAASYLHPVINGLLCVRGVQQAMMHCFGTGPGQGGPSMLQSNERSMGLGAAYEQAYEDLGQVVLAMEAQETISREYFGSLIELDAFDDLAPLLAPYTATLTPVPVGVQTDILVAMNGYDIEPDSIQNLFDRWNLTMEAWGNAVFEPDAQYPGIIDSLVIEDLHGVIWDVYQYALDRGFGSISELYISVGDFINGLAGESNAPCATVSVQLSQTVTMTREAFTGTLGIFNGHPTDAMDSLSVNIRITDMDDNLSNGLFQINTQTVTNLGDVTGTGSLNAQENGSVQFLFIPTIAAAPTVPKPYNFGGSVTYWDPFMDTLVTMPLNPVQLTVNPSPDLMLHYFLERNILGDDALTPGVVEPSIPAELAVMIENNGYGPAVNMTISSAQPQIIDNESGLAINFELIGSNLQGQPTALGVTNIHFGTIPPLGTRIGQWYMTSSLLGRFVDYDAQVVHNNSFNNPELILIQGAELHELTHSIKVYGAMDDGINDFLVNDLFDPHDVPDVIYLSQGTITYEVVEAEIGSFSTPVLPPTFTNTLSVTASEPGWNYIKLDDPGDGMYDLVSVTRNSDGQAIPLNNAWLTFVNMPVAQQHFYENKFHFVDDFSTAGTPVSYSVVWAPKNFDVPEVTRIEGAPENVTAEQVTHLTVVFSKPIDPATFTFSDLSLVFQGGPDIMDASATITQVNDTTFTLDLSMFTTGNGTYVFAAQAAGVADVYGINGSLGRQVSWTQCLTVPTVQAFQGVPSPALAASFSTIDVLFNLPIDLASAPAERFRIVLDGDTLPGLLTIDSVSADLKLFHLSGLDALLTDDGAYQLVVDLPQIRSTGLVYGLQQQSITLTVDNTGPMLVNLVPTTEGGLDPQHRTWMGIAFNEGVVGFNTAALQLTHNGDAIALNIAQLAYITPAQWRAGSFGLATYYDGDYTFTVDMSLVHDALGNVGTGTQQVQWTVDRSASVEITDLGIDPDLGWDDSDGISSVLAVDAHFTLSADATQVTVSQVSFGSELVLATLQNVPAGPVSLPVTFIAGGNTGVKVMAVGSNGGAASAQKALFLDQVPLTATWGMANGSVLEQQLAQLPIAFSDQLLDDGDLLSVLQFRRNGQPIPPTDIGITAVDATHYIVTSLDAASAEAGLYELRIDLTQLHKHSSGRAGAATASVQWNVLGGNTVRLAAKVFLQGPYVADLNMMHDALRAQDHLPLIEPYTGIGYPHVGGGGESTSAPVLAVTGANAIVDWVVIELRDKADASIVLLTRSALLQRDGDVVDLDGISPVLLQHAPDQYHVAIRHRNHLGAMTAASVPLNATPSALDLTSPGTATYGTEARTSINGRMALWCGDVNRDGTLKYTGQFNDRDPILVRIGGSVPTNTLYGYWSEDVDLDGEVKYTGENNDRDPILRNIGGVVPTNIRVGQLP